MPAIASLKATNGVVAQARYAPAYDNAIARANAGRFNCGVRFAVLAA